MYKVFFRRPSYSGKASYVVETDSLSKVAAMIEESVIRKNGPGVWTVSGLTNKEMKILWNKCFAIETKRMNKEGTTNPYYINYLRGIYRRMPKQ